MAYQPRMPKPRMKNKEAPKVYNAIALTDISLCKWNNHIRRENESLCWYVWQAKKHTELHKDHKNDMFSFQFHGPPPLEGAMSFFRQYMFLYGHLYACILYSQFLV